MRKVWVITFSVILLLFLGLLIFNLFDGLSRISLSTPTQNLALSPTPISIFTPTIALTPAPTASAIPTPSANELVPSLIQISDYSGAWDKLKESFSSGLIKTTVSPVKVEFWLGWNILKNTVGEIIFPLLSALIVILIIILLVFRLLTSGKYYQMVIDDFKYGSVHYENEEVGTSISGKVRESLFRYYSGEKEGLPATIDQPSMNKDENRFKLQV
jgi:hypothetical protein